LATILVGNTDVGSGRLAVLLAPRFQTSGRLGLVNSAALLVALFGAIRHQKDPITL
jgi:hypothetical protein